MWLLASRTRVLAGLSLSALVLGLAAPTHAQESSDPDLRLETTADADEDLTVETVPQAITPITIGDDDPEQPRRRRIAEEDPYAPLGLRTGAFTLFPTLEVRSGVSVEHNNSTGTSSSLITELRPGLRMESDWSRHQLTLSGNASLGYETGADEALSMSGKLQGDLRVDIRRGTTADLGVSYEAKQADANASDSSLEHILGTSASLTHDLGGLEARLRLGVIRNVFDDTELSGGGTQDNGDRAKTEFSVALRGSANRNAILTPFAEVGYDQRIYDQKQDRNGFARSSQGLRLTAGIALSDDPIWTGEIAANLLYRSYDDSSLDDALAPGVSAAITWRPTDLTRFEFNADVSLAETVAAGESATTRWSAGYTVSHELRENLTASAGVSLVKESGGTDALTLETDLGLAWILNRNMVLGLNYVGEYADGATDRQEHSLIGSIILRR